MADRGTAEFSEGRVGESLRRRDPLVLVDSVVENEVQRKGGGQTDSTADVCSYETGALGPVSSMSFPGRAREGGC